MIVLVLILNFVFLGLLLSIGSYTARVAKSKQTTNHYVRQQFLYQPLALLVGLVSLIATYAINPENFKTYFKVGDAGAAAAPLKILGISANDNWMSIAMTMGTIISIVTIIYMYLQIKRSKKSLSISQLTPLILPVLLFAAMNSFTEEMITRMGIVSPLAGHYEALLIFAISAIVFGVPHFFGTPKGMAGMALAGFLGFILAKSVYETHGIAIAWGIHFVQDVIIIGALALLAGTKARHRA